MSVVASLPFLAGLQAQLLFSIGIKFNPAMILHAPLPKSRVFKGYPGVTIAIANTLCGFLRLAKTRSLPLILESQFNLQPTSS
jgi:hypothetical protein